MSRNSSSRNGVSSVAQYPFSLTSRASVSSSRFAAKYWFQARLFLSHLSSCKLSGTPYSVASKYRAFSSDFFGAICPFTSALRLARIIHRQPARSASSRRKLNTAPAFFDRTSRQGHRTPADRCRGRRNSQKSLSYCLVPHQELARYAAMAPFEAVSYAAYRLPLKPQIPYCRLCAFGLLEQARGLDAAGIDIVVVGAASSIFSANAPDYQRSNIHHAGYVGDDDLAALYDGALCLAFPSKTEGFGIPPLEATARGCPVISSNAASLIEIGGNAVAYVDPDHGEGWRDAIIGLAGNQELFVRRWRRRGERERRYSPGSAAHSCTLAKSCGCRLDVREAIDDEGESRRAGPSVRLRGAASRGRPSPNVCPWGDPDSILTERRPKL